MRRALLAFFGTIAGLVVLLSFKSQAVPTPAVLPAAVATGPVNGGTPTTSTPTAGDSAGAVAPSATPSASATGATTPDTNATYTGDAAQTRYGPVQVRITVGGGRVTAVQAVDYPQGNPRDAEINAQAIPQLNAEAVAAGNARIDTVSGATYTSDGYLQSLQSALDQAGL